MEYRGGRRFQSRWETRPALAKQCDGRLHDLVDEWLAVSQQHKPAVTSSELERLRARPISMATATTDILWQNNVTGARVVWFMNGTALQRERKPRSSIYTMEHCRRRGFQRRRATRYPISEQCDRRAADLADEWGHTHPVQ